MDQRDQELARILIGYSIRLRKDERLLIEVTDEGAPLVREIIKEAYRAGGVPFVKVSQLDLRREWLLGATPEALSQAAAYEVARMKDMQAYIGLRGPRNANETGDVPADKLQAYRKYYSQPIDAVRLPHTKWCVMRYPCPSLAQLAGMSTEAFTDFYYRICCLDYAKMSRAMDSLVAVMRATDRVRLTGPGTDLSFSVKGIPVIKCAGEMNLPDGEVFTAPVRDSVNGLISFNTPAEYEGFTFTDLSFNFRNGRIVEATANDPERLQKILDIDEGARYAGEFALGVNPFILKPIQETLFDEKIMGSFHFTPGHCYNEASNGNQSAIHWDLVNIQTPAYGGGEIYFDGELIRKDGLFVAKGLEVLNPDRLA